MSISREQAAHLAKVHAQAQALRVRAAPPADAGVQAHSYLLSALDDPSWQPHAWVVDAVQAAYQLGKDEA